MAAKTGSVIASLALVTTTSEVASAEPSFPAHGRQNALQRTAIKDPSVLAAIWRQGSVQQTPRRGGVTPDLPGPFSIPLPPTCHDAAASPNRIEITRFYSCNAFEDIITSHRTVNGLPADPIGTASIVVISYSVWSASSRSWAIVQEFTEIAATGADVGEPVLVVGGNVCVTSSFCTIMSNPVYVSTVQVYPEADLEGSYVSSLGTATTTGYIASDNVSEIFGVPTTPDAYNTGLLRCDSQFFPAGCADPYYVATVVFSSQLNPLIGPIAVHVQLAQQSLVNHWGRQGAGPPLTRDTSQADRTAANNMACPPGLYPGQSCDEYPMASTYQSALYNSDYSTTGVPPSANSSQGGVLSQFYANRRVIDHDAYWVSVIP